jgi:hypothetical protein
MESRSGCLRHSKKKRDNVEPKKKNRQCKVINFDLKLYFGKKNLDFLHYLYKNLNKKKQFLYILGAPKFAEQLNEVMSIHVSK